MWHEIEAYLGNINMIHIITHRLKFSNFIKSMMIWFKRKMWNQLHLFGLQHFCPLRYVDNIYLENKVAAWFGLDSLIVPIYVSEKNKYRLCWEMLTSFIYLWKMFHLMQSQKALGEPHSQEQPTARPFLASGEVRSGVPHKWNNSLKEKISQ